jgi:hypothetical protein
MQEMQLAFAIQMGLQKMKHSGTPFNPSIARLVTDFSHFDGSGVIALPPEKNLKDPRGYDLIKYAKPEVPELEITIDDIWECAKDHYGLTAAATASGLAGIPIPKKFFGYKVHGNASKYTTYPSHIGRKFFPLARLQNGSTAARVAKKTFGTLRIFGLIGRAAPFVALGLAVFDVISIGMCAYEAKHGK